MCALEVWGGPIQLYTRDTLIRVKLIGYVLYVTEQILHKESYKLLRYYFMYACALIILNTSRSQTGDKTTAMVSPSPLLPQPVRLSPLPTSGPEICTFFKRAMWTQSKRANTRKVIFARFLPTGAQNSPKQPPLQAPLYLPCWEKICPARRRAEQCYAKLSD